MGQSLFFDLHLRAHMTVSQFLIGCYRGNAPTVEPLGGLWRQVDAAMTARPTEVVVPVGAVERNPIFFDVDDPGHTGQVKAAGGEVTGCHVACGTFMEREKISAGGCIR